MGGPGSGPRPRDYTVPEVELPRLGDSLEDIMAYMNAVTDALARGDLDKSRAEVMIAAARVQQRACDALYNRSKIQMLEKMLRDAKAVAAKGEAHAAAERLHREKQ